MLRHAVFTGPHGESEHLCLLVRLQSEKAADLCCPGVDNSSRDKVVRVGINVLQQLKTIAEQLGLDGIVIFHPS